MNNVIRLFNEVRPAPKKPKRSRHSKAWRKKCLKGWIDAVLNHDAASVRHKTESLDLSQFEGLTEAELKAVLTLVSSTYNRACEEQRKYFRKERES